MIRYHGIIAQRKSQSRTTAKSWPVYPSSPFITLGLDEQSYSGMHRGGGVPVGATVAVAVAVTVVVVVVVT